MSHYTIGCVADSDIGENLISTPLAAVRDGGRAIAGSATAATTKKLHPTQQRHAFHTQMKKKSGRVSPGDRVRDYASAAMEQMELYRRAHPRSPSAVRRPKLFLRSELWIALLGPTMEEGIVGIGPTVEAALRAFDAQYLAGSDSPS